MVWLRNQSSVPNELPVEIKALIDTVLDGFNRKDSPQYNSAFSGDAVVIDGMAPYRWTGPGAPARWFTDAEKWAHEIAVENETIDCDRIVHAALVGTHAYAVLSATHSFRLKGQSVSRPGILTFTFAKHVDQWKVDSQAWGRLS
jgi:ketosteroid isomerase-like protein